MARFADLLVFWAPHNRQNTLDPGADMEELTRVFALPPRRPSPALRAPSPGGSGFSSSTTLSRRERVPEGRVRGGASRRRPLALFCAATVLFGSTASSAEPPA